MELILKYFPALTRQQVEQFSALDSLYKEWNAQINVISRKDIESLYEKHVLHSLSIASAYQLNAGTEIIDVGTGGGFPGIPLAIFFPEVNFHLVDSINKKLKVIEAVTATLGLKNVTTQHTRAEAITNRKFDVAISRAVAHLSDLWKWCKPLLKTTTAHKFGNMPQDRILSSGLLCLKGGDLAEEIAGSRLYPKIVEISGFYTEEYFKEKYILHVTG